MSGINIIGTGRYVPGFTVHNRDFEAIVDTSDDWIQTRTGMQDRRVSLGEPAWYMGAEAAKNALDAAGVAPDAIDMVLLTTVSTDYAFPSTASIVQQQIGAENAFSLDIGVACAGVTYSLDMARRYLMTGDVDTVLLIAAENLTQSVDYTDRGSCILFGDGAGAMLVRRGENLFASHLHTDIGGTGHTYCKQSLRELPFQTPGYEEIEPFPIKARDGIYLNGREVYKFATKAMPAALETACRKAGLTPADLDWIIPHQANLRIIETAAKNLGVPMDRIIVNIERYANTSSASIPICLDECIRGGRIRRGDTLGLVGFGAGLSLGANVLTY